MGFSLLAMISPRHGKGIRGIRRAPARKEMAPMGPREEAMGDNHERAELKPSTFFFASKLGPPNAVFHLLGTHGSYSL